MAAVLQDVGAIPVPDHLIEVGEHDRRKYVGGSDISKVLGIDPYGGTPLTCYLAKRGELAGIADPEKVKFLERRKRWEGPIVQMLREEFGGNIVATNRRFIERDQDYFGAEIDAEWIDDAGEPQNLELKTVSPFAFNEGAGWGEAGTDEVPFHYHAQCMWGLGIMRRKTCILAALAGLDTMVFYRIDRDQETIDAMREAAVAFWRDHVLTGIPPEPITMGDVGRLWNRRNGRPVELDEETAGKLEHLRQARGEAKAVEGDIEELQLDIAKAICKAWGVADGTEPPADNAVLTFRGRKVATWARGRSTFMDQKGLRAEHPEVAAKFTRETHFRAFRFPKS